MKRLNEIEFEIPIKAVGQARGRSRAIIPSKASIQEWLIAYNLGRLSIDGFYNNLRKSTYASVYKASSQKEHEDAIMSILDEFAPETPIQGPVSVTITALIKPPKSTTKKRLKEILFQPHDVKPDVDNIEKDLYDCMTKAGFWADDCQIWSSFTAKSWSEEDKILIHILY